MRQINLLQNDLKCSRKNLKLNHPLAIRRPNTHTKVLRSSKILLTLGLNIFLHSWGLPYLCFSESLSRNLITSACFSFAMYHAFHLQTSCTRLTLFIQIAPSSPLLSHATVSVYYGISVEDSEKEEKCRKIFSIDPGTLSPAPWLEA